MTKKPEDAPKGPFHKPVAPAMIGLPPESPYSDRAENAAAGMFDYFLGLFQAGKSWPPKD